LKYLEEIPEEQSSFEGACYIFDHRGAIVSGLKPVDRKFLDEREQWRLEASEESVG
jgi:predicted sulfurtransferase